MNVRDVLLESIISSIEEEKASCVENDIIDNILSSIQTLRESIAQAKERFAQK